MRLDTTRLIAMRSRLSPWEKPTPCKKMRMIFRLEDCGSAGVKMISAMQNEDGGWRYGRGGESDMSMFGWQLMALKSAVNGGIPVPEDTRRGMVKFLEARGRGHMVALRVTKKMINQHPP